VTSHPEPFKNPDARLDDLGYGDRDASVFLRGDGTWSVPPAGLPVKVAAGNLGSSYTVDTSVGKDILLTGTLNANVTFGTPTGASAGTTITFQLTQDGTGGRAITWFTCKKPGGNLVQSSTAAAIDIYTAYYDGTDWYVFAAGIGMA
jgi:hypothetical protein